MTDAGACTSVMLRALRGQPLEDAAVREMVVATAHAIAERQGVVVTGVDAEPDRITVTLRADRLVALGLVAELRRLTGRWYQAKHGATLWGDA
jgi:hypothetical protein